MAPTAPPSHLSVSSTNRAASSEWKGVSMQPGVRLRAAGGKDIKVSKNAMKNSLKKSTDDLKNQKFLFVFDGLVGVKDAGTIGKVLDLDTASPRVVFDGDGGNVELVGKKYHTKSRFLPLLFNKSSEVNVSDIFTEVVVFSSGTLETKVVGVEVTPEAKAMMHRGGSELSEVGIKGVKREGGGEDYEGKGGEGEEAMLEEAFGGKERRMSGRSNKSTVSYGGLDEDASDDDEMEMDSVGGGDNDDDDDDEDAVPQRERAPRRKSAESKIDYSLMDGDSDSDDFEIVSPPGEARKKLEQELSKPKPKPKPKAKAKVKQEVIILDDSDEEVVERKKPAVKKAPKKSPSKKRKADSSDEEMEFDDNDDFDVERRTSSGRGSARKNISYVESEDDDDDEELEEEFGDGDSDDDSDASFEEQKKKVKKKEKPKPKPKVKEKKAEVIKKSPAKEKAIPIKKKKAKIIEESEESEESEEAEFDMNDDDSDF
ncbi:hypothetical protein TrVE_jg6547 [Triparma verrucosa]|uniref:Uncharacterized protein n=1 Tax=Triparma verrucosa TaxID=1606542 RepID=A0A9W7KUD3_9STRA|nr:hypothetical protein TrVE_jg6547 [Triparma verrucosa]